MNAELDRWNREEANLQIHGTTGCRPLDRFPEGGPGALSHRFALSVGTSEHPDGYRDGWVNWKGQRYSIPLS